MAKFVAVEDFKGFDSGDPDNPWQAVPKSETREVKLVESDDNTTWEVASGIGPAQGLEFYTGKRVSSTERIIPLHGKDVGSYEFRALDSQTKKVTAKLFVDVVKPRTVAIAYYFLPGAQRWDSRVLNDLAHKILFDQSGISLKWLSEWDNKMGETITLPPGKYVNIEDRAVRSALWGYGNHTAAGLLVYFHGGRVGDSRGPGAAVTMGGQTLINSFGHKPTEQDLMTKTLAHEIGHFLSPPGHDDNKDDLMFDGPADVHGKRIRKKRNLGFARG